MAFEKYHVLSVDPKASPDDIKRAYYRMVRQHPPEKDPDRFKAIRSAYETLSDPQARDAYDTIEQYGDEIVELLSEAEELMSNSKWGEAARRLKHVLVLAPHADAAWNNLGLCQLHGGQFDVAAKTYAGLTERNPAVPVYWANFGSSFHEQAKLDGVAESTKARLFKRARKCYRKAIELEDYNPGHWMAVSRAYADEDRLDLAVKWAEKAARCRRDGPEDHEALFWLCIVQLRRGALDEIAFLAGRIMAALPDSDEARKYAAHRLGALGVSLHELNAFRAAAVMYSAARQFDPENDGLRGLHERSQAAALAMEEYAQIEVDAGVLPAIRVLAAMHLADMRGEMADTSQDERKRIIDNVLRALSQIPLQHTMESLRRLRVQYPASYRLGQSGYEAILRLVQDAAAAQAKRSACFVVTATFGTPYAPEVDACRRFREEYLLPTALGRGLVGIYQAVGPELARLVRRYPASRRLLAPALGFLIRHLPSARSTERVERGRTGQCGDVEDGL